MKRKLIFFTCSLALFFIYAAWLHGAAPTGWEELIYLQISSRASPVRTQALRYFTRLCDPLVIGVFCFVLLLLPRTRWKIGVPAAAAAVFSALFNQLLKQIFMRERPDAAVWLIAESGYSFPSGHSTVSAALAVVFIWAATRFIHTPWQRRLCIMAACFFPVLIGLSRVYLGVHYAGDVLGGWLSGCACGLAACLPEKWYRKKCKLC